MTASVIHPALDCHLAVRAPGRVYEFIAYAFPPDGAFQVGWPVVPGAVRYSDSDRPALLHFAPARWLVPSASPEIEALVSAAVDAGLGAAVDVDGKWTAYALLGTDAGRLLASCVDVTSVLSGRDCAALTLFDCPAVVAPEAGGYAIWVRSSYASHFVAAIERHRSPR